MDMLIANRKFFIRFYLRLYFFYDYMRNDGLKALHSKWRLPDAVWIAVSFPRLKAGVTLDNAFQAIMNTLLADANRHTVFEAFQSGGDENGAPEILRVDDFREIAVYDAGDDLHA